jgi:hypothetical protein
VKRRIDILIVRFCLSANDVLIKATSGLPKIILVSVPNLQGAAVKIFGVGRGGGEERTPLSVPRLNKLLDFWNTLFERSGASPVTISQNLVAD